MHKHLTIIVLIYLALVVGTVAWLSKPNHAVLAQAENAGWNRNFSVVVKHVGQSFRTELFVEQSLISSYAFYEGSVPPTNAVIGWPDLNKFEVIFDNGIRIKCDWNSETYGSVTWRVE